MGGIYPTGTKVGSANPSATAIGNDPRAEKNPKGNLHWRLRFGFSDTILSGDRTAFVPARRQPIRRKRGLPDGTFPVMPWRLRGR
jgi:hypothetical protein